MTVQHMPMISEVVHHWLVQAIKTFYRYITLFMYICQYSRRAGSLGSAPSLAGASAHTVDTGNIIIIDGASTHAVDTGYTII